MAFGGEIDDRVGAVLGEQAGDQRAVTDAAVDEAVLGAVGDGRQRVDVAGVGQRIEVDDALAAARERVEDEIATDEAGAAGDQQGFHRRARGMT